MLVYIQDVNGQPLMPTIRCGKVRKLLKDKKAKVINRCPFTIKLNYETTNHKQEITLGVDAGSKTIGISATTSTKELYTSEVELRNDIVSLVSTRREQRRSRRNRKTRYRAPRFNNRIKSKHKGWLAPSIEHKIQTHLREATSHGNKILKFECDEYEYHYGSSYDKCAAQDTKYTKLEDKIEHIIEVLERIADNRDERERQRKLEEERRKVEEERKRLEEEERKRLQALKDAELEKVRELIFNSDRLKIAQIIREYVEEFRLHMQEQGLSDEAAMLNEIEWMKKKADFIDPFVKYPDELLTEKDIEKLINPEIIKTSESKPSYSYYHSEPQYSYWQIKNIWRKM